MWSPESADSRSSPSPGSHPAATGDDPAATADLSAVTPEDVRLELRRVVESRAFAGSERLKRFLTYAVEKALLGQGSQLKEYVLAVEVFDRRDSFDPDADAIVRVEARRLRAKLATYYSTEGRDSRLVIEMPKGGYAPVVRFRPGDAPPTAPPAEGTAGLAALGPGRPRPDRRRFWLGAALVAAVACAAVAIYLLSTARSQRPPPSSVAVLPFTVLSTGAETEYFADGLVDELTTAVAKIEGLRVVARTSAYQFRGQHLDVRSIGPKLGVGAVVEGSVRRSGDRARITAQLIDVSDGYHLWSETYERNSRDLLAIQDEIAAAIAAALKLRLVVATNDPASAPTLPNAEARDLCLRGRYHRNQMTVDGLLKALPLFEQAVAKDPNYAAARCALAGTLATLGFHGLKPAAESAQRAKALAGRALELDPALAEAHGILGWTSFYYDWDWPAAEAAFARGLRLNPSDARLHQWYAFGLVTRRRFQEAVDQSRAARDSDSLSFLASNDLASILYHAGRYDESIRQSRQSLEMNADLVAARVTIGQCLLAQKDIEGAIAELQLARHVPFLGVEGRLAHAFAMAGRRDEAFELLRAIQARREGGGEPNMEMAFALVGLGDSAGALDALESAVEARESETLFLDVTPQFEPLRSDPRFETLRHRLRLTR